VKEANSNKDRDAESNAIRNITFHYNNKSRAKKHVYKIAYIYIVKTFINTRQKKIKLTAQKSHTAAWSEA